MTVIKVSGLTKDYNVRKKESTSTKLASLRHLISPPTAKLRALKAINFELNEGEFLGYIGPNGSGKSTTIKLLTGVLTPTEGSASVLGYTPWKRQKIFTRQIGVIFGNKSLLFWDLPVLDSLKLYKDVYNLNKEEFEARLEEFNKSYEALRNDPEAWAEIERERAIWDNTLLDGLELDEIWTEDGNVTYRKKDK